AARSSSLHPPVGFNTAVKVCLYSCLLPRPPTPTLFPYTTLFRSVLKAARASDAVMSGTRRRSILAEALCGRIVFPPGPVYPPTRSEEHTSELQSLRHLVCRLLLEKKYWSISAFPGSCSCLLYL